MTTASSASASGLEPGTLRVWYPEVGSTMDVAASLAAHGAPHGTLVEAGFQSSGRGRQGRRWDAPPGSALLTSWILRIPPGHDTGVLSPLIALALMRTLHDLDPAVPAQFKWPNDVWLAGDKAAGVLLTARHGGDEVVVIAGIGVNVRRPAESPPGTAWLSDWLPECTPGDLRSALANALGTMWRHYLSEGAMSAADLARLEGAMLWRGELVEVRAGTESISGSIAGMDETGSLLLRPPDGGDVQVLRAGEVTRGPRITARASRNGAVYFPEQDS